MPNLRFRDDGTLGTALGQLAAGINAANDPQKQMMGAYYGQLVNASRANEAKSLLDAQVLRDQMAAANAASDAAVNAFTTANPRPVLTLPPGAQGPEMPEAMQAPILSNYDAQTAFMRANTRNAYLRGGGPMDALKVGPAAISMGGVMLNGAPSEEAAARTTQTMLTGQLPDARTPFTDAGRGLLSAEDLAQKKELEAYKISNTPLDFTGGKVYGVPQRDAAGTVSYRTVGGPQALGSMGAGGFYGDSIDAQAQRMIEMSLVRMRQGTASPEDFDNYETAYTHRYGAKTELRDNGQGGQIPVVIRPEVPSNFPHPSQLRQALNMPVRVPGVQPQASVQTAAVPTSTQTDASPAGPVSSPATAMPAGTMPAVAGGTPVPTGAGVAVGAQITANKPMGQEATKLADYASRMELAHNELVEMEKTGRVPGLYQEVVSDPQSFGGGAVGKVATRVLGNTAGKEYTGSKNSFLDAVLRNQSGAVIGTAEYDKVAGYTMPTADDTPVQRSTKRANRELLINAYKNGVLGETPQQIVANAKGIIEQAMMEGRRSAPGARTTGPDPFAETDRLVGLGR